MTEPKASKIPQVRRRTIAASKLRPKNHINQGHSKTHSEKKGVVSNLKTPRKSSKTPGKIDDGATSAKKQVGFVDWKSSLRGGPLTAEKEAHKQKEVHKQQENLRPVRRHLSFDKKEKISVRRPIATRSNSWKEQVSSLTQSLEESQRRVSSLEEELAKKTFEEEELRIRNEEVEEQLKTREESVERRLSVERMAWEQKLLRAGINPVNLEKLPVADLDSDKQRIQEHVSSLRQKLELFVTETADTLQLLQTHDPESDPVETSAHQTSLHCKATEV